MTNPQGVIPGTRLAAFTKLPEAAAPIAGGILIGLGLSVRDRVLAAVVGLCVSAGLIFGLLRLQTGPWATWYLWDLPGQHEIVVREAGFEDYNEKAMIEPGKILDVHVIMERDSRAKYPDPKTSAQVRLDVSPDRIVVTTGCR